MAAETLSTISAALSQLFAPTLFRQMNRVAVTTSVIDAEAGQGDAKNVAWDTEFSGATAYPVADGSDVVASEYNQDVPVPATLSWANYRSAFQISENEIDAAARSMGTPSMLMNIFRDRVTGSITKVASTINGDVMTGTGTGSDPSAASVPDIVGLFGGALEATGSYAGILQSSYSEWAGNVLSNGATARPLTLDLLQQLEGAIFTACGEQPDLIVMSPGGFRKYQGLFEDIRRIPGDRGLTYNTGPEEKMLPQESVFFRGIPVIRDKDCPSGKLLMLNRNYLKLKFLPHLNPGDAFGYETGMLVGTTGGTPSGSVTPTQIPLSVRLLAKTGDSVKGEVKVTCQLAVMRRNSMGYISDLSES